MEKHQVLLVCLLPLLCEGLQRILQPLEDVECVCLQGADLSALDDGLKAFQPEMVLVAGENETDESTHLISGLLKRFADVPIVWVDLATNVLRMYTSHTLPANSADLIETIRQQRPAHTDEPAFSGGKNHAA